MPNNPSSSDGIRGFALKMIEERLSDKQKNSPQIQAMIQAIQNNDAEAGSKLAENICKSYGMTKEQILTQVLGDLGLG